MNNCFKIFKLLLCYLLGLSLRFLEFLYVCDPENIILIFIMILQLAWIMSEFIQSFCILMLPVISGLSEVSWHVCMNVPSPNDVSGEMRFIFATGFTIPIASNSYLCLKLIMSLQLLLSFWITHWMRYGTLRAVILIRILPARISHILILSQVCNGATYVNVDMVVNRKDSTRMLLIEGIFTIFRKLLYY